MSNPFEGMFQDSEGKVPVTAEGQRVGLITHPRIPYDFVQPNAADRPAVSGGKLISGFLKGKAKAGIAPA